jgi:hypothetical protein
VTLLCSFDSKTTSPATEQHRKSLLEVTNRYVIAKPRLLTAGLRLNLTFEQRGVSDDYNKADERSQLDQLIADEFGVNADYVSELLRQFERNPSAVDQEWSAYFNQTAGRESAAHQSTPCPLGKKVSYTHLNRPSHHQGARDFSSAQRLVRARESKRPTA